MSTGTLDLAELDTSSLARLLDRSDPAGVLSIFADVAPGARGTEIDLRNRLTELRRRVDPATSDALARLEPELRALADPTGRGRGRALFVPLGRDAPMRFTTNLRLPNRVVLDERPFVHPLLECLERGRPAGVVLLSAELAEILEWRDGQALVLAHIEAQAEPPREAPPLRERRARDRRRRFVEQVASEVREIAARRSWDRLVVSGGDALTRPFVAALPAPLAEHAIRDPRHLIDVETTTLIDMVGDLLERQQEAWDLRLTQAIREAAMAGSGGALGLSEVAAALNDARVAHLVYDPEIRYAGALGEDGWIVIPPEVHPLGLPVEPEARLTERLLERCLATGARITPVRGEAGTLLSEMGGIAARLRW